MKRILATIIFAVSFLLIYLRADAKQSKLTGYETATVVSVDKLAASSSYIGSPSDAPLQAESYNYDVGIRLNCNVYVGRYESATDYLPAVFAPNHSVDVRLEKHLIFVSLPESDRVVKMGIISHKKLSEQACPVNG